MEVFTHIIETDEAEQICFTVQNLAAVRSQVGIDFFNGRLSNC